MNADCVIVDANIAFRCLHAGRGDLRERVGPGGHPQFFSPRFLFVELFKHKKRLETGANLPEAELLDALYALVSRLEFVNEDRRDQERKAAVEKKLEKLKNSK